MTIQILESFMVNWVIAGLLGWGIWFLLSFVNIIWRTKGDLYTIQKLQDCNDGTASFSKRPPRRKARIIARTVIWPWGILEVTQMLETDLKKIGV